MKDWKRSKDLRHPAVSLKRIESKRKLEFTIASNLRGARRNILELVEAFTSAEQKFGIPAQILQALAFIESSYILGAVNSRSNDFGLMQVNEYNIKAYKFDKHLLLTDMKYSANAGARVFKWFYDRYPLEEAVARYNCGTRPSCVNYRSVKNYVAKFKKAL